MDKILADVKRYDIAKIREKLGEYGVTVGPITPGTKSLFEKRLAKKMFESTGGKVDDNDRDDNTDVVKAPNVPQMHTAQTSGPVIYYGICLPEDIDPQLANEGTQLVFSDKVEAMRMAKKLKGSRFKVFKKQEEANKFSKLTAESAFQSPRKSQKETLECCSQVSTESSPYRAPKPQDIVVVRLAIERGDSKTFEEYIWSNPRYLVSSGDTPVIYQEGSRYTAMHVAAMKNKPAICRLILNVLEDPQFVSDLYRMSKITEDAVNTRIGFLVDLYLNMPDKGNCESPLHMACKFGHEQVVEILAAHPRTDRVLRNKWGDSPNDVICTRCPHASATTKERIAELLKGQCYVPLIRSEDNSTQPLIGEPWSPDVTSSPLDVTRPTQGPCDPTVCVRACAGPMSPSNADLFHKRWTTPPSRIPAQARIYFETKRSDCEKGLERIGRHLAHEMAVPWLEYWTFLDAYVDLSTLKGLDILEEYFRKSLWVAFYKGYRERFGAETGPDPALLCTPVKPTPRRLHTEVTDSPGQDSVFSIGATAGLFAKKAESDCDVKPTVSQSVSDKDREQTSSEGGANTVVSPITSLSQRFAELSVLDRSRSDKATINTSHGSVFSELYGSVSSTAEHGVNPSTSCDGNTVNTNNVTGDLSTASENAGTSTDDFSTESNGVDASNVTSDLSTASDRADTSTGGAGTESNGVDASNVTSDLSTASDRADTSTGGAGTESNGVDTSNVTSDLSTTSDRADTSTGGAGTKSNGVDTSNVTSDLSTTSDRADTSTGGAGTESNGVDTSNVTSDLSTTSDRADTSTGGAGTESNGVDTSNVTSDLSTTSDRADTSTGGAGTESNGVDTSNVTSDLSTTSDRADTSTGGAGTESNGVDTSNVTSDLSTTSDRADTSTGGAGTKSNGVDTSNVTSDLSTTSDRADTSTGGAGTKSNGVDTSNVTSDLSTTSDRADTSMGGAGTESNGVDVSNTQSYTETGGKQNQQSAADSKSDKELEPVSDTSSSAKAKPVLDKGLDKLPEPVSNTRTDDQERPTASDENTDTLNNTGEEEYFDSVTDLSEIIKSEHTTEESVSEHGVLSDIDGTAIAELGAKFTILGSNGIDLEVVALHGDTNQTDTDLNLSVAGDRVTRQLSDRSDSMSSYKTAEEEISDSSLPFELQLSELNPVNVYIKLKDGTIVKKLEQVCEQRDLNSSVQLLVRLQSFVLSGGLKLDIVMIPDVESMSQMVGLYENVEVQSCEGDIQALGEGNVVDIGGPGDTGDDLKFTAHFTRASPTQKVGYIYGPLPCREDLDVSRALGDVFISPEHHPNVFHWKINLSRFTSNKKYRWQSPAKLISKQLPSSPQAPPSPRPSPGVPYGSPVHLFGQGRAASGGIRTKLFATIQEL